MTSPGLHVRDEAGMAVRNRRLGTILFGVFAALATFSIVFIYLRSVGR